METHDKKLQDLEAVKKLQDLVKEVRICMFTTLDDDNKVNSRPMSTITVDDEGNAWFFTNEFSEKIGEVSKDNMVNLIYSSPSKNVYVNVAGSCTVIIDRKKMEELWEPSLKKWFPAGLDDPKICLVKVTTEEAFFWNDTSSKMSVFFKAITRKKESYKESEKGKLDLN